MKHLGISGGGTKIAGLFGAAETIIYEKGYQPEIISGISSGAILSLPLALGKREEIKKLVLNLELDTFFSRVPIKKTGGLKIVNAIRTLVQKKRSFGEQKNLEKQLALVVPRNEFEAYKLDNAKAHCIVGCVDFCTGKRFYINLKDVSYEHFLGFVNASASIPVFTPGIRMGVIKDFEGEVTTGNLLLYDGGVRDHSPSQKILSSEHPDFQVSETVTLFSRPENLNEILDPTFTPKNVLEILERHIEITNAEISKNDFTQEQQLINEKGIINHGTIYIPRVLKNTYDVDHNRLQKLYELSGGDNVTKYWKNEGLIT